ncbi:MAG: NFACT family protein [Firmicutes bacterium]|nr:NFACT family protein [Bacillota bacterium]
MSFSGLFLKGLLTEITPGLIQARIDKIYNYHNEYHFNLRAQRSRLVLVVSIDPKNFRLQLTEEKPPVTYPEKPNSFCMLLRRHLVGLPITAVNQPGLERIVFVDFTAGYGEDLKPRRYQLVCELMGRNSNLILVGPDGFILGAARQSSVEQNAHREVVPGAEYIPPPKQNSKNLLGLDSPFFRRSLLLAPPEEELRQGLLRTIQGIDKWMATRILESAGLSPDLKRSQLKDFQLNHLWEQVQKLKNITASGQWEPTMLVDKSGKPLDYEPFSLGVSSSRSFSGFSPLLDAFFLPLYSQEQETVTKKDLSSALKREIKKVKKKLKAQEKDYASAENAAEYKNKADLIMAYLYQIQPGSSSIYLPSFEDGSQVVIQLDPAKKPADNAELYYKKYAKAKRKRERALQELTKTKDYLAYLEQLQEDLRQQETPEDLTAIEEELISLGILKAKKDAPKQKRKVRPGLQYKQVALSDGTEILIGINSRQNDYVTMTKANPNDYWFHIKDQPGSHVILKTSGRGPSEEEIITAARLAATYSKAYQSRKVEIDYTQRKNVWKPKGAKPGMVLYKNYQTLVVEPFDQETLQGLMKGGSSAEE